MAICDVDRTGQLCFGDGYIPLPKLSISPNGFIKPAPLSIPECGVKCTGVTSHGERIHRPLHRDGVPRLPQTALVVGEKGMR
jgi:hypothetical protein